MKPKSGDWHDTTLGAVVAQTGGVIQTGPFGSQLHASDYVPDGTPLVMPVNLGDNAIIEGGIARVGAKDVMRLSRHVLREGDIVFSRRGDVGRRSIVSHAEAGWLCGTGCLAVRFGSRRDETNSRFIAVCLGSATVQTWLFDNAVGGTMPNLNTRILASTPIRIPTRQLQDSIVAALHDATSVVTTMERLIAKKQAMKQGMMQQLINGQTRLPGFTEPWISKSLHELVSYEQPGQFLVQTSKQLESGRFPVLTAGKTFVLGYTNETEGVYVDHPVVIFDDFTTASKFVDFDFKAKSSAMKILKALPGVNVRFVCERMQMINFVIGDHKRHWISEYSEQSIGVPEPAEQDAIASVIVDADSEIQSLQARLTKAKAVKQGMMQELLTGRTRLPMGELTGD